MSKPYESTFQINVPADDNGVSRLAGIVSLLQTELSAGGSASAFDIELESGDAGNYGYAMVTTERPHPSLADQSMQLEVRLCTAGDESVEANFRSRFITADGVDPPELRAGPPRLLLSVVERFDCSAGGFPVGEAALTVDNHTMDAFVADTVCNVNRTLPLLVCSELPNGEVPLDLERIQRDLLGLAQVVRLRDNATLRFRQLTELALLQRRRALALAEFPILPQRQAAQHLLCAGRIIPQRCAVSPAANRSGTRRRQQRL